MDFFEVVNPHVPELTKNEHLLFDYVVKNLNAIKNKSIREISDDCFVSTTTFLRFVRKIGFSGYSEFTTVIKYTLLNQTIQEKASPFVVSQKDYREEYLKNINESVRVIDTQKLITVAEYLKSKPIIYLFAKGMNKQLMNYAKYLFVAAGFLVVFPDDHPTRKVVQKQITSKDIVFVLTYQGKDEEWIHLMQYLKNKIQPLVVSLTGADNNVVQNMSDINFYVFTDELFLNKMEITSHISIIAILELILYQYLESADDGEYHLVFR
ncbi:MurR/RpiR family transcriptional regulator [Enterococcus rivorum]|uniref:RpiR family transcriptional regulator n=1 Tax=Enterococcus rivorum TaxID=762845 RepID=A0A1E5KS82_9ENTE|nr:MurR/RpiR family transcriptional regulator [Enterococcus rivorum]MBP2097403.1 RpiR family glv operon transcriptional regulator [Enterococcus rivorum]OEH80752.1 RpiR family transcriptional regulator [Enterococcus rivorum]